MTRFAASLLALGLGLVSSPAGAHSAGQSGPGCLGCHGGGDYSISVSTSPANFAPGATVTVTLSVASVSGSVLGTFIGANAGQLDTIAGQGLAQVAAGLTHSSPKSMQGGAASFDFAWTAPSSPGAVRFDVSTLVGNGNGQSSGDLASGGFFDFVYGCMPATYYRDSDGDGFGRDDQPLIHCQGAPPNGYANEGGDCNDSHEGIHPGAVEVCNQLDDDCDGEVDDDAIPAELYPDGDGDGYYGAEEYASGDTMMGCVPLAGWAAEGGDCKPDDPDVNPGADEICNLIDDNCSGRIDEGVRPRCGEGWCESEASSCNSESCFPGEPRDEICNLFDDDCDGLVDNDAPCDDGLVCIAGECRDDPTSEPVPSADDGGCTIHGAPRPAWLAALLVAAVAIRRRRSRRSA